MAATVEISILAATNEGTPVTTMEVFRSLDLEASS